MILKHLFYDLGGINTYLFYVINRLEHGAAYDRFVMLGAQAGSPSMFTFYAPLIIFVALACIVVAKLELPLQYPEIRDRWVITLMVLFGAYLLADRGTLWLNDWFQYPRPFASLPKDPPYRLLAANIAPEEYLRTFPSRHAVFIMVMVAGLWPVLESLTRLILLALAAWVGWSCVAVGLNFPMDVLAGYALAFLGVGVVRWGITHLYELLKTQLARKPLQKT